MTGLSSNGWLPEAEQDALLPCEVKKWKGLMQPDFQRLAITLANIFYTYCDVITFSLRGVRLGGQYAQYARKDTKTTVHGKAPSQRIERGL